MIKIVPSILGFFEIDLKQLKYWTDRTDPFLVIAEPEAENSN